MALKGEVRRAGKFSASVGDGPAVSSVPVVGERGGGREDSGSVGREYFGMRAV